MNKRNWREEVVQYSKDLRLPMIRQHFEEYVKDAAERDVGYEEFLAYYYKKKRIQGKKLQDITAFAELNFRIKSTWRIYLYWIYPKMPKRNISVLKRLIL